MKVVFRVDASVSIGTGHVMRCITLAKQLRKLDFDIYFICRELKGNLVKFIKDDGFKIYSLSSKNDEMKDLQWYEEFWNIDSNETIRVLQQQGIFPELLIVDHYGLDEKWEKEAGSFALKTLVIDDLANRKHNCDLLIDQNFYLNLEDRYTNLVPDTCKKFLGPLYVLLREEFFKVSQNKRIRDGTIKNILVFFGGSDPTNETLKTLDAIGSLSLRDIKVTVVVGSSNQMRREIEDYCNQNPQWNYYCQVSNMAELMKEADLAIGAGGTTTWERCYFGLPSMTIIVADNQVEATEAVSTVGATINLGCYHEVTKKKIADTIMELSDNPKRLLALSESALKLVNLKFDNENPLLKAILEEFSSGNSR